MAALDAWFCSLVGKTVHYLELSSLYRQARNEIVHFGDADAQIETTICRSYKVRFLKSPQIMQMHINNKVNNWGQADETKYKGLADATVWMTKAKHLRKPHVWGPHLSKPSLSISKDDRLPRRSNGLSLLPDSLNRQRYSYGRSWTLDHFETASRLYLYASSLAMCRDSITVGMRLCSLPINDSVFSCSRGNLETATWSLWQRKGSLPDFQR